MMPGRSSHDARALLATYMRGEGATEGEIQAKLYSLFDRNVGDDCPTCDGSGCAHCEPGAE